MGLFGGIKSTWRKSEAAVLLEGLLERQEKLGLLHLEPRSLANKLVTETWEAAPDIFDGRFGQRPHKLLVAASALARAVVSCSDTNENRGALILALGNVLSELEVNGRLYPLNSLDHQLLEKAISVFAAVAQESAESPLAKTMDEIMGRSAYDTWEDWYCVFKKAAANHNVQLAVDEQGNSLVDLMEHEPLQRAFSKCVDPETLAEQFAAQFDVRTFGLER